MSLFIHTNGVAGKQLYWFATLTLPEPKIGTLGSSIQHIPLVSDGVFCRMIGVLGLVGWTIVLDYVRYGTHVG
jgi:hypothetical protein